MQRMDEALKAGQREREEESQRDLLQAAKFAEREKIKSLQSTIIMYKEFIPDLAAQVAEYEASASSYEDGGKGEVAIRYRGMAARSGERLDQARKDLEQAEESLQVARDRLNSRGASFRARGTFRPTLSDECGLRIGVSYSVADIHCCSRRSPLPRLKAVTTANAPQTTSNGLKVAKNPSFIVCSVNS